MSLLPLQLFKNLALMKLGWGSWLLLKARGELCVCGSLYGLASPSPRSPPFWRCSVRADCCWIVNRVSGSITASPADAGWAAQVIEQAALSQRGDRCGMMISRRLAGWVAGKNLS